MDWIFLCLVIFLFVLAVSDLWVGVSNDAVNFLNSAIGSRAAGFRTIIVIAAMGVFFGAIMSNGMMDIARHGIFRPEQFSFQELMFIFLAVMVTDIILLDVFNSLGMPTSTTVSMVFELLGATFGLTILKMVSADAGLGFSDYMNTEKALSVIMAIFVSVAIAFVTGLLVQYISRILFTFQYKGKLRYKIGIFGGIAVTAIVYFMLIKGTKDLTFMTPELKLWIRENTWTLLLCCLCGFTVLMQVLYWLKVNVFKVVVLIGTFALATAFAGNDLVNFIGVPLSGFASYQDYVLSGSSDPSAHMMGVLNEKASTPFVFLLGSGIVMVMALALSKKAHKVTETEINLARQDESDEMFGTSRVARSMVRWGNSVGAFFSRITPEPVGKWIDSRFDKNEIEMEDGAAYDLVRASVNLVVASLLIALGTSLKLPLSTTYVTFMVAMSTSLADRAWGRESAVFRITGVLSVIGGWLLTAAVAFACAFILALVMYFGGNIAAILIVLAGLAALIHNNINFKHKEGRKEQDTVNRILTSHDRNAAWTIFAGYLADSETDFLKMISACYEKVTDGLMTENVRILRKSTIELKREKVNFKNLRKKMTLCLRSSETERALKKSAWFHMLFNSMEQLYYSLRRIAEPSYEHIDNNFSPIPEDYSKDFAAKRDMLLELMNFIADKCRSGDFEAVRESDPRTEFLQKEFSDMRKVLIRDMSTKDMNLSVAYLYLNLLQESEQMAIEIRQLSRATRKFQVG